MITTPPEVFPEINSRTIPELWSMLGLPGDPKPRGDMRSPFRDERNPSFSIHDDGFAWKDHGSGLGGDGVEFVKVALGTDHSGVRDWWLDRTGSGGHDREVRRALPQRPASTTKEPEPWKVIEFPGPLSEGTEETWKAFAEQRGLSIPGVRLAVRAGALRFLRLDNGRACYCLTDPTLRAAEVRDWKGNPFGDSKAFPLKGCSKRWLPGLAHALTSWPAEAAGILILEGATDYLTSFDLYHRWKSQGGAQSWIPAAILGAACKSLAPEAEQAIRGRRVRMIPDADPAGDAMATHWRDVFLRLGCRVDTIKLPRGCDLTDVAGKIKLEGLFS